MKKTEYLPFIYLANLQFLHFSHLYLRRIICFPCQIRFAISQNKSLPKFIRVYKHHDHIETKMGKKYNRYHNMPLCVGSLKSNELFAFDNCKQSISCKVHFSIMIR